MAASEFCYAGTVEIPVSIVLFFLLSGFFLFTLLAALQRSGKAAIVAGVCLVAVGLVIGLARPVQLLPGGDDKAESTTTTSDQGVASSDTTGSTTTESPASSSTTTESTTTTIIVASGPGWEETFELEAVW